MVYIVTPCSRPEHLLQMKQSIPEECKWIVAYDDNCDTEWMLDDVINCTGLGIRDSSWGNVIRNWVLDNYKFEDGDWIYYLDDDNIIKEDWYKHINVYLNSDAAILTWGQKYANGDERLHPNPKPEPFKIDTACFMVNWKHVKDIRWGDKIESDGYYAQECASKGRLFKIPHFLCYYNYISGIKHPGQKEYTCTFQHQGNHGNIFFQYAFMRLFADRYKMCSRLPLWEDSYPVDKAFLKNMFEGKLNPNGLEKIELEIHKDRSNELLEHTWHGIEYDHPRNFLHYWNGDAIVSSDIKLSGYFQNYELFEDFEKVKSYFNIPQVDVCDEVCVNLRLGDDFKALNMVAEPNGSLDLLDTLEFNELVIVCDVYDKDYIQHFSKFSPKGERRTKQTIVCREGREPEADFAELLRYK